MGGSFRLVVLLSSSVDLRREGERTVQTAFSFLATQRAKNLLDFVAIMKSSKAVNAEKSRVFFNYSLRVEFFFFFKYINTGFRI